MNVKSSVKIEQVQCEVVPEISNATWSNCLVIGKEVVFSGVTARGSDGSPEGG